jgi:HemK-related putative methylase
MDNDLSVFEELGQFLDEHHYRILIHNLTNGRIHRTPWTQCPVTQLAKLPRRTELILRLFHLGETVEGAHELLSDNLVRSLTRAGLFQEQEQGLSLGNYTILPFEGIYLIAQKWQHGTPTTNEHLWLGEDTSYVAKSLSPSRSERVLEVCTGIGTHALVMAARGANVCGVDINPEAVRVAAWNAWLNDLQKRMRFDHGDLYEPVKNERFDYIVSSPPFLPYPEDGDNEIWCATAGPDGLDLMRRILDELGDHLTAKGRALFLAAGFGDDKGPDFIQELESRAVKEGWKIDLIIFGDGEVRSELKRLGNELPSVAKELDMLAGQLQKRITRYYSFLVAVQVNPVEPVGCQVINCCMSWAERLRQLRASK